MQILRGVLLALLAVSVTMAALDGRIKRIVVLMEENRSYDHLMGWNKKSKNGLSNRDCNRLNITDAKSQNICATAEAPYVNFCDPDHSFPSTTYKIFGTEHPSKNQEPLMDGFVEFERDMRHHKNPKLQYCGVMDAFSPERTPVLTALTEEFVFFDKFFASLPGPTWPNRLFFLSGTSNGLTETIPWYKLIPGSLFPQKTIFDQVEEAGNTWSYYYDDTPWELFVEKLAHSPERTFNMDRFYKDAADGNLPNFAFINPRSGVDLETGVGSNDMHPDHDVALGEKLYKDIYEALRASPQWNETLYIVTFDEHGGLYDHMHPPKDVPPPDDVKSYPDKFSFDRGGIRIPTLLASPWLPKGMVVSDPPASSKPFNNSAFELTSIMSTVRKLLPNMTNTPALTKRDGWAASFEYLFNILEEPRTDCPMKLPDAPPPSKFMAKIEGNQPVNGLQKAIMDVHSQLNDVPYPHHIKRQADVGTWVKDHHQQHRERTFRWKASKASPKWFLALGDFDLSLFHEFTWTRNESSKPGVQTLSMTIDKKSLCVDAGNMTVGTTLTMTDCYPSADPVVNRDKAQQWTFSASDFSLRPASNHGLCATVNPAAGQKAVRLALCDDSIKVHQTFGYMGGVPGSKGGHVTFDYGDAFMQIGAYLL